MADSILQFTIEFEKLKSRIDRIESECMKLAGLIDFWPSLKNHLDDDAYELFIREFYLQLGSLATFQNTEDLTIEELVTLNDVVFRVIPDNRDGSNIKEIAVSALAEKYFYVGAVNRALKAVERIFPEASEMSISPDKHINEFELFNQVCEQAKGISDRLHQFLLRILFKWEAVKESVDSTGINCLFVERNETNLPQRGVIKRLAGTVELFKKDTAADEIAFDKVSIRPDDPFVGVTYKALQAVRNLYGRNKSDDRGKRHYHAHFSLGISSERFTGDSIGLAAAVYAYVELLRTEITRQDRFIASDVAFTGSIDAGGNILPVNEVSLKAKVERVFFSPVKYLVVPAIHKEMAESSLNDLCQDYPNRRLQLIGASHITDIIENRNIIRSEKVCMGEYIGKKTHRYSRMARIQVPLLLILIYFLVCQLYPKAWIGFDWNPAFVKTDVQGFEILNKDSLFIWSKVYECDTIIYISSQVYDLDNDKKNEIAIIPRSPKHLYCHDNAKLFVYDDNGDLLFERFCVKSGILKFDSSLNQFYFAGNIHIISCKNNPVIITTVNESYPGRSYIRIWNNNGDSLGWYINDGHATYKSHKDIDNDGAVELLCSGINNDLGMGCFFGIDLNSCYGISPPYPNSLLGNIPKKYNGKQLCYYVFPNSGLRGYYGHEYPTKINIYPEIQKLIQVDILERDNNLKLIENAYISYFFDNELKLSRVGISDGYKNIRDSLAAINKLKPTDWDEQKKEIFDNVLKWVDSSWVAVKELGYNYSDN